ncbi:putative sugar nucleotidyl transferase, partial [Xanthovirga aplysinae]|uniref:putative sugar nucleotidyl transferase n=1 Tax=Xanthovirga aplysinae TaxID=2529853 RepID=UPI0012BBE3F5
IRTIVEKWDHLLKTEISFLTEDYLQEKYPLETGPVNLFINGALCPDHELVNKISSLQPQEALVKGDLLLALVSNAPTPPSIQELIELNNFHKKEYNQEISLINQPSDIFRLNEAQIRSDFKEITADRKSAPIDDPHTIVYGKENIFVEEGARIRAAILNAEKGPIYIGKNAEVHEGAIIKGSFALLENSHVNMGAKMRGDTTVGPFSKVGGEIGNSVIFGYSNKAHEGYMGNSVIGEWCNIGADSNTSNLKNNYANVKIWNYAKEGFKDTGLLFCGLIMGDHSKCGINTMFNTGTVAGVSANIFGDGFPRNFIPSFAWGGASGFTTFQLRKVFEVAEKVMERRGLQLEEVDKAIMKHIFYITAKFRAWEK